ncbi:MAG: hypothetical protein ACLFVU_02380 [Phycisphaerae bacterium]
MMRTGFILTALILTSALAGCNGPGSGSGFAGNRSADVPQREGLDMTPRQLTVRILEAIEARNEIGLDTYMNKHTDLVLQQPGRKADALKPAAFLKKVKIEFDASDAEIEVDEGANVARTVARLPGTGGTPAKATLHVRLKACTCGGWRVGEIRFVEGG